MTRLPVDESAGSAEQPLTDPIPFVDFSANGEVIHFASPNAYTAESFSQFLTPIAEQFRLLAMHPRQLWPGSRPADMTSWTLFSDDLIRFLDQHGLQNIIGMGHSLGAVATMMAAIKRPDLFSRLILIDPVFLPPAVLQTLRADPEKAWDMPRVKGALRRRDQWASRQDAYRRFRDKSIFSRFSDETLHDYVNNSMRDNDDGTVSLRFPRAWEAQIYAYDPVFVWDELPNITHPTLCLRGAESVILGSDAWARWKELQPGAIFVEVADTGHMLTMERPLAVAENVLDFLVK